MKRTTKDRPFEEGRSDLRRVDSKSGSRRGRVFARTQRLWGRVSGTEFGLETSKPDGEGTELKGILENSSLQKSLSLERGSRILYLYIPLMREFSPPPVALGPRPLWRRKHEPKRRPWKGLPVPTRRLSGGTKVDKPTLPPLRSPVLVLLWFFTREWSRVGSES